MAKHDTRWQGGDVNLGAKLEGLDDLRVDDLDEDEHRQAPLWGCDKDVVMAGRAMMMPMAVRNYGEARGRGRCTR